MLGGGCSACCGPCRCSFPEELHVRWNPGNASNQPGVTVSKAASAQIWNTADFEGSDQGLIFGAQAYGVAAYAYRNAYTDPQLGTWSRSAERGPPGSSLCQWSGKGFSLPTWSVDLPSESGPEFTGVVFADVLLRVYSSEQFPCYWVEWGTTIVSVRTISAPCGTYCYTIVRDLGAAKSGSGIPATNNIASFEQLCIYRGIGFASKTENSFLTSFNTSTCFLRTTTLEGYLTVFEL